MEAAYRNITDYTLSDPPPKNHPKLGEWVYSLFEDSYAEKERLGWMDRAVENYKMFRGNHWGEKKRQSKDRISVNLNFANIQRTVANITAKNPVAEVVDLDGYEDSADQVLSLKLKKWWNETEQQGLLCRSAINNEIYGITIEKAVWNSNKKEYIPVLIDGYSYFPAPGYFASCQEMPYIIHAYPMSIDEVEKTFNIKGVTSEDVRTILGQEDREEVRPNQIIAGRESGVVKEQKKTTDLLTREGEAGEALVLELWIKDYSTKLVTVGVEIHPETGQEIAIQEKQRCYPDGIRVITICNQGTLLNDMPNPNINLEMEKNVVKSSYAWGKYPFYIANSYEDTTSNWGFAAVEQTGDLNKKIDEIVSRMTAYCNRVLFPTLIIEKGCGITKQMINNKPGLVLMPTRPGARIEYLQVPNLPSNFFQILDTLVTFHDRVYQIEDADRGVQPTGVTAASAIVSLQERNAVLIRHKIRAAEYLCRERGRWHISFLQNFSIEIEHIQLEEEVVEFSGIELAGRKFSYIIESDSTVAKTSMQEQEQAVGLYKINAIDRKALLEILNFPNYKQVLERVGEGQLDAALQILIDAGMEKEQAAQLKQYLMQPNQKTKQATSGQSGQQPQPGTPKIQQGQNNASI